MELNPNWVAALGSLASAIVVAITAVAAFLQIRHVRNSNEITVFLKLVEHIDSLEAEVAFTGIEPFVTSVKSDPEVRKRLMTRERVEGANDIESLLQFLEHLSTLVVTGGITERLVLTEYADSIVLLWSNLAEMIYLRRVGMGPYYGATFEHIAMRARRFIDSGQMKRFYGRLERDERMATFAPSRNS